MAKEIVFYRLAGHERATSFGIYSVHVRLIWARHCGLLVKTPTKAKKPVGLNCGGALRFVGENTNKGGNAAGLNCGRHCGLLVKTPTKAKKITIMKNLKINLFAYLLFIMTATASLGCYSQKNRGYKNALDYIVKIHPNDHLVVSDTIARLSFVFFTDELDSLWNKKNAKATYDLLDSVDHSNDSIKTRVTILTNKRFMGQEPEKIVYFSPFYNYMVIGEILERRFKDVGLRHTTQAAFNSSIEYLFIFDKHYKLKKVFTAKIQYD